MQLNMLEHQKLIDYLDNERERRNLDQQEFATLLGMSPQVYANLRSYKRPGLKVCLHIARVLRLQSDYVLYLAGHIEEHELDSPNEIPPELLPTLARLQQLKGTPFFDTAVELLERTIDSVMKLFQKAA
jgi:transcriptional regulator with XRE-family HTH domain